LDSDELSAICWRSVSMKYSSRSWFQGVWVGDRAPSHNDEAHEIRSGNGNQHPSWDMVSEASSKITQSSNGSNASVGALPFVFRLLSL